MRVRWSGRSLAASGLIIGLYVMTLVLLGRAAPGRTALSFDDAVLRIIGGSLLFLGPFALGHRYLRRAERSGNGLYALLGALSALPSFLLVVDAEFLTHSVANGTASLALLRPAVVGALVGFIYRRGAGVENGGDDPDELAVFTPGTGPDDGVTSTLCAEYFAGPLQVRLSFGAVCSAALCGGVCLLLALLIGSVLHDRATLMLHAMLPDGKAAAGVSIAGFLLFGMPPLLLVGIGAILLRRLGWTARWQAAAIGLAVATVAGVLIGLTLRHPLPSALAGTIALPSMLAMLTYRSLAGLEPRSLPEDIEVNDRRTLVGADHVRRRVHRVVEFSRRA